MHDKHDLELILNSHIPLVEVITREEQRALKLLQELSRGMPQPFFQWKVTEGLSSLHFSLSDEMPQTEPADVLTHIKSKQGAGVYVLLDFHHYLDDPVNVRLIKDIALQYDSQKKTLVLMSHELELPGELRAYSARFELSLPGTERIKAIVREQADDWASSNPGRKVKTDSRSYQSLVNNLAGLTSREIARLARTAIFDDGVIDETDLPEVMKAKYGLLDQKGQLHFEYETAPFSSVGGFVRLKRWLEQRKSAFSNENLQLDRPKGILLLGVQGCGKSLAAKAVAGIWNLPLLRLDVGALYNKFHGETEKNFREALRSAQVMAPCVLWIDEIEKAFSTSDSDGGTSQRVLGGLLTWMAENEKSVFIVATANDIQRLPPELVRKGRMDEIFFVDLPDHTTRKNIFEIHLRRRNLEPANFNSGEMAGRTAGFSGAEIEQAVVSALYLAHAQGENLRDDHVFEEIARTQPLSVVMAEQINALREWAESRTVSAH